MKLKALSLLVFVALIFAMNMCGLEAAMAAISAASVAPAHECCPKPADQPVQAQLKACCADLVFHEPSSLRLEKISGYQLTDFAKHLLILTPNTFTNSIHAGDISFLESEPQAAPPPDANLTGAGSIHAPPSAS